ncbi:hypothetical protein HY484_03985 [Candidatus Woesearchaeota archaeon]|nr:hypothetical protein [Candidatus Woesearchaeota archaeon]
MDKHVIVLFSFVAVVAFAGLFVTEILNNAEITGNYARQKTQGVLIARTQSIQSYTPQKSTATTGLIIKNGKTPYTIMTGTAGLGTTMAGIVSVGGLPVSTSLLQEKGIIFGNDGYLYTQDGNDVQIKDAEQRRKPIKLTFGGQPQTKEKSYRRV